MTAVRLPPTTSDRGYAPARRATTRFLAEALRAPRQIGAIAQSGPHLAAQAAGLFIPDDGPQVIVELGPGAGAITDVLHARMPAGSRLVGVEINTSMVEGLRRTRPWLNVIHGDAIDLPTLIRAAGLPPPDLIISALPWSMISAAAQPRILAAISEAMHPRGTFATVTTLPVRVLPAAQRFRRHLHHTFASVSQTRIVWRNIPPAHLYICRSPYDQPAPGGRRPA